MTNICALLWAAALISAPIEVPRLPTDAYRLPNGLKVVLHRDVSVPRVTVCVAYHVGSKNERAGRTGFAHFFEHMMFRGTKLVPNYDLPLQEAGASANAFTTEDVTVYHETIPSNYLERTLYLEAERLAFLGTALDQAKFDTEREVVKNERRQRYENVPYGLAEETILATLFPPGHPYSWSVIGSMRDLNAAAIGDLVQFFEEFYHPGNACLSIAGDFDPAQARAWILKYFGPIPGGAGAAAVAAPVVSAVDRRVRQTDQVQLPRIYWSWPTAADDHPDAPALSLLATLLAGGETSRLHRALVLDRRLATDVAAASETKEIAGLFTLQATAAEGKSLADVERVIASEIERLRQEGPSQAELDRAIARFERSTYTGLAGSQRRAFTLALSFLQKNDPEYYRKDYARYFVVGPKDVQRVAITYLVPQKLALEIQPLRKDESESEALQTGPAASSAPKPSTRSKLASDAGWTRMPAPTAEPSFAPPTFERRTLSNGIQVWICPWKTLPIVSVRLILPMGSADDPTDLSGLATLTATLLDKGTKELTATQLAERFEALGIEPSVAAGAENSRLSFTCAARRLNPALELVAGMLKEPRFDAVDFDREKQLQLAELLQGPDRPTWIAQRAFRRLVYSAPLDRPLDGTAEAVRRISLADARAFHRRRLASDRTLMIVVGDVSAEPLVASLEATLGSWKTPDADKTERRNQGEAKFADKTLYLIDKPGAVQSVLILGARWRRRSDEGYLETLLGNRIVGGDFLSRLNQNLREKNGYTYGAYSSLNYHRTAPSVWSMQASVRADATAAAVQEATAELQAIEKARPIADEEFEVNRDAEARAFPEAFEEPSGIASALEESAIFQLPDDYLSTFADKLKRVQLTKTQETTAKLTHQDGRCVLVVGDRKTVEPELRKLRQSPFEPFPWTESMRPRPTRTSDQKSKPGVPPGPTPRKI